MINPPFPDDVHLLTPCSAWSSCCSSGACIVSPGSWLVTCDVAELCTRAESRIWSVVETITPEAQVSFYWVQDVIADEVLLLAESFTIEVGVERVTRRLGRVLNWNHVLLWCVTFVDISKLLGDAYHRILNQTVWAHVVPDTHVIRRRLLVLLHLQLKIWRLVHSYNLIIF